MMVKMPFWVALVVIPGGWTVCYFVGNWAQSIGVGWF